MSPKRSVQKSNSEKVRACLNREGEAAPKHAKSQPCFADVRRKILQVVKRIPLGRVASYKSIADLSGRPGRARLVGRALHDSQDAPWWRVVRSDGTCAIPQQRELLSVEGVPNRAGRVEMRRFAWPNAEEILAVDSLLELDALN